MLIPALVEAGITSIVFEERYGTHEGYVAAIRAAAERLVKQRLLLAEDAARLVHDAEGSSILR